MSNLHSLPEISKVQLNPFLRSPSPFLPSTLFLVCFIPLRGLICDFPSHFLGSLSILETSSHQYFSLPLIKNHPSTPYYSSLILLGTLHQYLINLEASYKRETWKNEYMILLKKT